MSGLLERSGATEQLSSRSTEALRVSTAGLRSFARVAFSPAADRPCLVSVYPRAQALGIGFLPESPLASALCQLAPSFKLSFQPSRQADRQAILSGLVQRFSMLENLHYQGTETDGDV
jgi:hypothetical protein